MSFTPSPATPARAPRLTFPAGLALLTAVAFLLTWSAAAPALADEVKLNGFWIEDVDVLSGSDGVLIYLSPAGAEVIRPLNQLEGLRMEKYPGLARADQQAQAGNREQAVRTLGAQREQVTEGWIQNFIDSRLVQLNNAIGKPLPAIDAYLRLATSGASPHYLENAPLDAVENAGEATRASVFNLINASLENVPGDSAAQPVLNAILEFTRPAAQPDAPQGNQPGEPTNGGEIKPPSLDRPDDGQVDVDDSAIEIVSLKLEERDELTNQLMRGEFDAVIQRSSELLEGVTAGNLYDLIYKRGLGYLGRARQTGSTEDYKHAGLDFMRIYVYTSVLSSLRPPATLAIAEVHHELGKPEIAARFLDEAQRSILDQETEPLLYARLQELAPEIQNTDP